MILKLNDNDFKNSFFFVQFINSFLFSTQTVERMPCQEKNDDELPEENYPKVKLKDCEEGDVFTIEEDPQCPDALKSLNENKNLPR